MIPVFMVLKGILTSSTVITNRTVTDIFANIIYPWDIAVTTSEFFAISLVDIPLPFAL